MGDPADIGFVDAHAEGDGGDHDQTIFSLETGFDVAAFVRVHAAVVVTGGVPGL